MAMNNSNFGFPPSGYSSPYSSTPSGIRTHRPRFGFSGPPMYPRPRSSASKPNPDSFSDSMINNYGTSTSRIDSSLNSENGYSYNDSFHTSGSNYYSANESFSNEQSYAETPMMHNESGYMRDNSMMHGYSGIRPLPYGDMKNSGILTKPPQYAAPNYNSTHGVSNKGEYKGNFQKNPSLGENNNKPFIKKFGKAKRMAAKETSWRCELCSLDFTSQIPYDMHLNGAKHAKKIKAKEALTAVQLQIDTTNTCYKSIAMTTSDGENVFFCELCNVKANSSLQLQTHLEGSKHKSKLHPKELKEESQEIEDSKESVQNLISSINEKTNGSLIRPLPADFGEPQPSKITKFACDACCISVNSETQLEQHLSSKKHQNKVEGKSAIKGKRHKKENKIVSIKTDKVPENTKVEQASNEASAKVVGVKTLASSFVQGGTLQ